MSKSYKKFALVGTSCVGKTTLLKDLASSLTKRYPNHKIAIVPEAARIYFELVKSKEPFSFKEQQKVQQLAKVLETHMQSMNPHIILADRSVIDAVAYVRAMGNLSGSNRLRKNTEDWSHTYDHLFLLDPVDITYEKDKVRKESKKTRTLFHEAFLAVLPEANVKWTLISGNKKKRLKQMLHIIDRS